MVNTTQHLEGGRWCRAGADWTGSVSLRALSSPWGGRCSTNSIIPDYCFKSVPTIHCAELFAQKDKNTFLVSVQVKHALLGRVRRLGSGMGTGVLVPEELFPSKFIQADVPLGTGAWFQAALSADV